jgi:hypothetical protein
MKNEGVTHEAYLYNDDNGHGLTYCGMPVFPWQAEDGVTLDCARCAENKKRLDAKEDPKVVFHFKSASCGGEKCRICQQPATHKVGEEIAHDDPNQCRHNLTAYLCCLHYTFVVGPAANCPGVVDPVTKKTYEEFYGITK